MCTACKVLHDVGLRLRFDVQSKYTSLTQKSSCCTIKRKRCRKYNNAWFGM